MLNRSLAIVSIDVILPDGRRRHLSVVRDMRTDRYQVTLRTRAGGPIENFWPDLGHDEYADLLRSFYAPAPAPAQEEEWGENRL